MLVRTDCATICSSDHRFVQVWRCYFASIRLPGQLFVAGIGTHVLFCLLLERSMSGHVRILMRIFIAEPGGLFLLCVFFHGPAEDLHTIVLLTRVVTFFPVYFCRSTSLASVQAVYGGKGHSADGHQPRHGGHDGELRRQRERAGGAALPSSGAPPLLPWSSSPPLIVLPLHARRSVAVVWLATLLGAA